MRSRDSWRRRPALEGLEWRLAPSGGPGPSPGGHHDVVDNDPNDDNDPPGDQGGRDAVDNDPNDDGDPSGGHWEPKPIGHGSTRPQLPPGPVKGGK